MYRRTDAHGPEISKEISQIFKNLYLSGVRPVSCGNVRELGITLIINATAELPNIHKDMDMNDNDQVELYKLNMDDNPEDKNFTNHFAKVAEIIENELKRKSGKVLIHCAAGVSRSASFCIAYLIKFKEMTLADAFLHVRSCRSIIRPNLLFFQNLIDFETELFGKTTVTMITMGELKIPQFYIQDYIRPLDFLSELKYLKPYLEKTETSE